MKQSKMLEFIRQWKGLERRQKDLDFERSRWCAELRAEFLSGDAGDKAFVKWLEVELGLPTERQEELLDRAAAFAVVPDPQQWRELGGFVQTKKLVPLDKKEQVAVIGAAKATGYRISTIVRQRESRPTVSHVPDVVLLAEFVEQLPDAPEDLRTLARKYIRARALKVA